MHCRRRSRPLSRAIVKKSLRGACTSSRSKFCSHQLSLRIAICRHAASEMSLRGVAVQQLYHWISHIIFRDPLEESAVPRHGIPFHSFHECRGRSHWSSNSWVHKSFTGPQNLPRLLLAQLPCHMLKAPRIWKANLSQAKLTDHLIPSLKATWWSLGKLVSSSGDTR